MEGIQTINALKAVVSSLPAQTTIPSSELVMLYAADGTPIAKIARDDLVKAVASVMASNSQNTFSKLLGVQANGTPMGIGASDLASVLGGGVPSSSVTSVGDFNLCTTPGVYSCNPSAMSNTPPTTQVSAQLIVRNGSTSQEGSFIQMLFCVNGDLYMREKYSTWYNWVQVATNIPVFYKNYSDLSSLASALGVPLGLEKYSANALQPQEESSEFTGSCMLIVDIENGAAVYIYVLSYWNSTLIQFAGSSDYSQRIEIVNNAGNTFRIKNISSDNINLNFRRISR